VLSVLPPDASSSAEVDPRPWGATAHRLIDVMARAGPPLPLGSPACMTSCQVTSGKVSIMIKEAIMATDVNTLSRLLQALAERRWEDAVTLGAALAKREERQGHFQAARRLRGALGETGNGDAGEVPWRATGGAPSALRALLPVSPVELEQSCFHATCANSSKNSPSSGDSTSSSSRPAWAGGASCCSSARQALWKNTHRTCARRDDFLAILVVRFDAIVGGTWDRPPPSFREVFAYAEAIPSCWCWTRSMPLPNVAATRARWANSTGWSSR